MGLALKISNQKVESGNSFLFNAYRKKRKAARNLSRNDSALEHNIHTIQMSKDSLGQKINLFLSIFSTSKRFSK